MIIGIGVGFVVGVVVTALGIAGMMRGRMLEVSPSPLATVEETVAAIEKGIAAAEGWSSPGVRDLNGMMAKHGVVFTPKVRLVEMCKARYAAEVLRDDRRVATLMPCALAVYEDDAGKVWLSRLNIGLLAKLFGGTVARVMGGGVAPEESRILAALGR
jgi:uncharacterized protein (DUF302 family)